MYDAIVVGARCAGAATAMLLARKGYRVLLADRATFPSEIPHGHVIHRGGPARLQRWGVLAEVVAGGCPPMRSYTLHLGDFPLVVRDLEAEGASFGYGPRRGLLDAVLVRAAVAAGAELRQGFVVEGYARAGERVTGIRGRTRRGTPVSESARITVGADGRRSLLARTVDALAYDATPPLSCWYFSYWSGVPALDGLEVYTVGTRSIIALPSSHGLACVMVAWPAHELARVRADVERELSAVLEGVPGLAARLREGRREERFYGASDLPNFLRTPCGPGWALVGDAGCHKDPFLGLGICDAFRDAELLADALDDGFAARVPLDDALARYRRQRDEATRADYALNIQFARSAPPPDIALFRAAVRGDPEATRCYFMTMEGMVPWTQFFALDCIRPLLPERPAAARP